MMDRVNLHEEFVKELFRKVPQKSELVDAISDILNIEREPASRRLSEKVQFSAREIGLLSKELGISLDSMIHDTNQQCWIPFLFKPPLGVKSMESLCDLMNNNLKQMEDIIKAPSQYKCIFNSLPMEFYISHPYLMKFMFFKWGQYCVGTEEFDNFSTWQLPKQLNGIEERLKSIVSGFTYVLYIWDNAIIWTLMEEIDYFHKMHVISDEDREHIVNDLKEMLKQLEKHLKGISKFDMYPENFDFYISNINIGIICFYLFSEEKQHFSFNNYFTFSTSKYNDTHENYTHIKNWIDSFKNVSALISGSGEIERRLFFKKQHKIISEFH